MSESRVLCEGYHDRAFWAGLLGHLGCSDEGYRPGTRHFPLLDPWNGRIAGGRFAYRTPSGAFVQVVPCNGKTNILREARIRLADRTTKALTRLVINVDPDINVVAATAGPTGLQQSTVLAMAQGFDAAASLNPDGEIELDGGTTRVALVRWETNDPATDGLPHLQTLERLVCAALVAANPAWAGAVKAWLDSRPSGPAAGPKEHAWSYMAGWYAEHGCQDFYTQVWREPAVVTQLEARLRHSNAWRIAQPGRMKRHGAHSGN